MSSPDEVSVRGTSLGPESGEHSGGCRFDSGLPRGHGLGSEERLLRSREDKLYHPVSKSFQYGSWLDRDDMEGRSVIWGCEGRPGTPVDEKGDSLDFDPQLTVEGTSIRQQVANREAWGVRRHLSPQSCGTELFDIWGDPDTGPSRRGTRALSSVEGKQASVGALHPRALGQGRAWVNLRRGIASRMVATEDVHHQTSDPESSDEVSEIQMMRVTICLKEGDQDKSAGPTELEHTFRHPNVQGREGFVHVPASVLATGPRGLTSGTERQALGELEASFPKKKQGMVWGKEGGRPSYPGASGASAAAPAPIPAAAGAVPKASPRRKTAQEKKPLWDPSKITLGRTFPPWGQRLKSAPVEPATFPPISGVALLGRANKYSLQPSEPKQCKHCGTGKKAMGRRTRETQQMTREESDPSRDASLQAQLPTQRAEQLCTCMHRGEMSSGDPNTRAMQVAGHSQLMALSQRGTRPRAPAPSGDHEPSVCPPIPAGERLSVAAPGCQQCLMLLKEIEELKEQLAVMHALNEKFQAI